MKNSKSFVLLLFIIYIIIAQQIFTGSCIDNCIQCTTSTHCNKCANSYILIHNSICLSCQVQNCQICDMHNSTYCTICKQGYIRASANSCTETLSTQILIAIILGSFSGVTIMFFTLMGCFHCYDKIMAKSQKLIQTKTDVNEIMETIIFTEANYDKARDECSICLTNECNLILKCNHYFHSQCLNEWIRQNATCPLCKSGQTNRVKLIECMNCKKSCKMINIQKINGIEEIANKCCSEIQ